MKILFRGLGGHWNVKKMFPCLVSREIKVMSVKSWFFSHFFICTSTR